MSRTLKSEKADEQVSGLDLSICIVTYQARDYLENCLRSIYEHTHGLNFEVLVVDNGSQDGTSEMVQESSPGATLIVNQVNLGFTQPANQAMKAARGNAVLLLNPDTLISANAFKKMITFLDENPAVGIVGPKVLNQEGTLQGPCRRSEARPWDVFTYFSGLAALFPRDKRFSGYTMSYLDENTSNEVDGVSGACMMIRRGVIDQIGYFDELFFAYQEDADYCLRARKAGWMVFYNPEAVITHFGGQGGSRVEPYRSIWAWHKSYFLYYRKHFAQDYIFIFNWFYFLAMTVKLGFSLLKNLFSRTAFGGSRKPG